VTTQRESQNKQLIRQAFDDWAAGTGGVFGLLAEDATWTIVGNTPVSRTFHSREEFLSEVIDPFNARLTTPLVPVVHALYADGDTVIAYFSASATAKDGKPYQNTYTWYLDLDLDLDLGGGKITNAVAFFDSIEFTDFWNRITPE
jgi:uncharacterized protein